LLEEGKSCTSLRVIHCILARIIMTREVRTERAPLCRNNLDSISVREHFPFYPPASASDNKKPTSICIVEPTASVENASDTKTREAFRDGARTRALMPLERLLGP